MEKSFILLCFGFAGVNGDALAPRFSHVPAEVEYTRNPYFTTADPCELRIQ